MYVSGDKFNIYVYWNVLLEVKNFLFKLEIMDVLYELNGFVIGFNDCIVYFVGYYGVYEIGRNINFDLKWLVFEIV